MITECKYKITEFNKTNRAVRQKCKRNKKFVIHCIGENNCRYIKEHNRILLEQEKK